MIKIRNVKIEDLRELVGIENLCFTEAEAATKEAFKKRIEFISDSFFVAEKDGIIVGLINGPVIDHPYITDDLFSEVKQNPVMGGHQSILGLAVAPHFQKQGIATQLLKTLEMDAKKKQRETVTLTCKELYIPFYARHGYCNKGISSSEHGGERWYNMVKEL